MKIDLTQTLNSIDGEPLADEGGALTLRRVIQTVCLNTLKGEEDVAGDLKWQLWKLANEANQDQVEWTPEQVSLIRERIGKGYGAVVVGPAWEALG